MNGVLHGMGMELKLAKATIDKLEADLEMAKAENMDLKRRLRRCEERMVEPGFMGLSRKQASILQLKLQEAQ